MIFDIRNPLHLLKLTIGRAQTSGAWRLPVFIVEHGNSPLAKDWEATIIRPGVTVHRKPWNSFVPEQLRSSRDGLLVANAVPGTVETIELFRWLQQNPISMPSLAGRASSVNAP